MLADYLYYPEHIQEFKQKALQWASLHNMACYLDSNHYPDRYSAFDVLIGVDSISELVEPVGRAFKALREFIDYHKSWALGFFSYDLKNELEDLCSSNPDYLDFPDLFFFIPKHLILIKGNEVSILSDCAEQVITDISRIDTSLSHRPKLSDINTRISKAAYLEKVERLKNHILRGDIYEVNFCQEFFSSQADIDPVLTFSELNKISPTPFANFFKIKDRFIISATPERFLCKRRNKVISQPIKGTARRKLTAREDELVKQKLRVDPKEQAENVMIVDLVRNDLTKSAVPGTVKVEELFGIYTFEQVHQMISTIVCDANPEISPVDLIANSFPMGSMTGAPPGSAMKLSEEFEETKRGSYSGSVGYFSPGGDFDFNVVIRSILYNQKTKYLSFHTGSAITSDSDAVKEYEECMLKAKAIFQTLN